MGTLHFFFQCTLPATTAVSLKCQPCCRNCVFKAAVAAAAVAGRCCLLRLLPAAAAAAAAAAGAGAGCCCFAAAGHHTAAAAAAADAKLYTFRPLPSPHVKWTFLQYRSIISVYKYVYTHLTPLHRNLDDKWTQRLRFDLNDCSAVEKPPDSASFRPPPLASSIASYCIDHFVTLPDAQQPTCFLQSALVLYGHDTCRITGLRRVSPFIPLLEDH